MVLLLPLTRTSFYLVGQLVCKLMKLCKTTVFLKLSTVVISWLSVCVCVCGAYSVLGSGRYYTCQELQNLIQVCKLRSVMFWQDQGPITSCCICELKLNSGDSHILAPSIIDQHMWLRIVDVALHASTKSSATSRSHPLFFCSTGIGLHPRSSPVGIQFTSSQVNEVQLIPLIVNGLGLPLTTLPGAAVRASAPAMLPS